MVVELPSLGHAVRLNSMIVMVVVGLSDGGHDHDGHDRDDHDFDHHGFETLPGRSTEGSKGPSQSPLRPCKHGPPGVDDDDYEERRRRSLCCCTLAAA